MMTVLEVVGDDAHARAPQARTPPVREDQPIVLRRERFGGIVFDPVDGTHLELDADGFELVRAWIMDGHEPVTPEQLDFAAALREEMPSLGTRPRRVRARLDLPEIAPTRHASVIGSPTLVDLQVTTRCTIGCPHCYSSSEAKGFDLSFEDASRLLHQLSAAGTCQIAIGGGEPLLHPDIIPIIELAHELGIVPNVTTTGLQMTPHVLEVMARCCGAVALSLEDVGEGFSKRRRSGFEFFESALVKLRAYGIRIVFQVTLSAENIARLPAIVEYCLGVPDLYGVIFLAYKPKGRGEGYDTPLSSLEPAELYPWLRQAFLRLRAHTRVGYDCCLTPGIAGLDRELGFGERDVLDGCSATRTSVGVSADLDVVPCTFLTHRAIGNLGQQSFMDIWLDGGATAFRKGLDTLGDGREACTTCSLRDDCLGGCPEWDLVRCTRRPLSDQAR